MTSATRSPYLADSPWTGRRTVAVFLAWLFGGVVGGVIAEVMGFSPLDSAAGLAIAVAFQSAAGLLAVTLYSQSAGTGSVKDDAGLVVLPRHWYGILLGIGVQVVVVFVVLLPLSNLFEIETESQAVSDVASGTTDSTGRVLLFLAFVIAAPVVEELLFRGVLLGWLTKRMNPRLAIAVSSLAFGLAHWEGTNVVLPVIGLTLLAVALGYAAVRTGHLSLAIFMHAGINLIAYIAIVYGDELEELAEELETGITLLFRWFM